MGMLLIYDGYTVADWRIDSPPLTFVQRGVASWYGREQQGHLTASGEIFNRHAFNRRKPPSPFQHHGAGDERKERPQCPGPHQ